MIWKLLVFIFQPDINKQKIWKLQYDKDKRIRMILKKVTKTDGSYMTSIEQLNFFSEISAQNGLNIVCYLFDNTTNRLVNKTDVDKPGCFNIPVIQISQDQFSATSLNQVFGINLKPKIF